MTDAEKRYLEVLRRKIDGAAAEVRYERWRRLNAEYAMSQASKRIRALEDQVKRGPFRTVGRQMSAGRSPDLVIAVEGP